MTSDFFIGLMSGTSLDGVDATVAQFEPHFKLIAKHHTPFSPQLRAQIQQLTLPGDNEIDLMGQVAHDLAEIYARSVEQLLLQSELQPAQVKAIGCHGQTIRHRPESGFTLQIGDASLLAELSGITTVADFRSRDLAAGGQGAPLVPAFHHALFHSSQLDRILLNVGGMANITYLPADSSKMVIGFDTGPGNILLDSWINQHKGLTYDENGNWGRTGNIHQELLSLLLSEPYFQEPHPKSTGRELFNLTWLEQKLSRFAHQLDQADVQATLTEFTAVTISNEINQLIPDNRFELFICGGGAHNSLLTQRLAVLLDGINVQDSAAIGLEADWMEATAFAWLAQRCIKGLSGNLPTVTGAKGERILGAIYPA